MTAKWNQDDRAKLHELVATKRMLANYRGTRAAMTGQSSSWDDVFIEVSRMEYESLVSLAVEGLRLKISTTNEDKG